VLELAVPGGVNRSLPELLLPRNLKDLAVEILHYLQLFLGEEVG